MDVVYQKPNDDENGFATRRTFSMTHTLRLVTRTVFFLFGCTIKKVRAPRLAPSLAPV